jgi:hypothetical protein
VFGDQLAVDRDGNRHFPDGLFAPARARHRDHVVDFGLRRLTGRLTGRGQRRNDGGCNAGGQ